MFKKLFIVLLIMLFCSNVGAMNLKWDEYTDSSSSELRIYQSTDPTKPREYTILIDNIPTSDVTVNVTTGPDNTRVYYIIRAYSADLDMESKNSNEVSYYWTINGGGILGPAGVTGFTLIDCGIANPDPVCP
jgi:hypothetical protein